MPNIFHQSVEDILKAATPEQRILWNDVFLRFGERIAISQLRYTGIYTGSRIGIYSADAMYVAYQLEVSAQYDGSAFSHYLTTYSPTNVIESIFMYSNPFWDATAAAVKFNSGFISLRNLLFSRISSSNGNTYINFIGYRIGR